MSAPSLGTGRCNDNLVSGQPHAPRGGVRAAHGGPSPKPAKGRPTGVLNAYYDYISLV